MLLSAVGSGRASGARNEPWSSGTSSRCAGRAFGSRGFARAHRDQRIDARSGRRLAKRLAEGMVRAERVGARSGLEVVELVDAWRLSRGAEPEIEIVRQWRGRRPEWIGCGRGRRAERIEVVGYRARALRRSRGPRAGLAARRALPGPALGRKQTSGALAEGLAGGAGACAYGTGVEGLPRPPRRPNSASGSSFGRPLAAGAWAANSRSPITCSV